MQKWGPAGLRTCARESSFGRSVLRSYHKSAKTGLFILYRSLWPNGVERNTGPVPCSSLNSLGYAFADVGSPLMASDCSEADQLLRTEGSTFFLGSAIPSSGPSKRPNNLRKPHCGLQRLWVTFERHDDWLVRLLAATLSQ